MMPLLLSDASSHTDPHYHQTVGDMAEHLSPLMHYVTLGGIALLIICILLCLWRVVKGPEIADRALAADTLSLCVAGLVIVMTLRIESETFIDGALLVALLGFAGTVAMSQFIAARHKHHPDDEEVNQS